MSFWLFSEFWPKQGGYPLLVVTEGYWMIITVDQITGFRGFLRIPDESGKLEITPFSRLACYFENKGLRFRVFVHKTGF